MQRTPREKDKLLIAMAAMVARRRLERGVKLNHPESVALISDFILEGARDGRTVADLMEAGAHVLTRARVMTGTGLIEATGLTRATVHAVCNDLISMGWVVEHDPGRNDASGINSQPRRAERAASSSLRKR